MEITNSTPQPKETLKQLRYQFETARKIVTAEGFYQKWINSLPNFKTGLDAFNHVNQLHYNVVLPHKYKYKSYLSFLNTTKHRKQN